MTCTGTELRVNRLSEVRLVQADTPSSNAMKVDDKDDSPNRCVCAGLTHRRLLQRQATIKMSTEQEAWSLQLQGVSAVCLTQGTLTMRQCMSGLRSLPLLTCSSSIIMLKGTLAPCPAGMECTTATSMLMLSRNQHKGCRVGNALHLHSHGCLS